MNALFRRSPDHVELSADDMADLDIPQPSLLDRAASATTGVLDNALAEKTRLERQLSDLTEQLRQVQVVIEAFSPIPSKLEAGIDPISPKRVKGRG